MPDPNPNSDGGTPVNWRWRCPTHGANGWRLAANRCCAEAVRFRATEQEGGVPNDVEIDLERLRAEDDGPASAHPQHPLATALAAEMGQDGGDFFAAACHRSDPHGPHAWRYKAYGEATEWQCPGRPARDELACPSAEPHDPHAWTGRVNSSPVGSWQCPGVPATPPAGADEITTGHAEVMPAGADEVRAAIERAIQRRSGDDPVTRNDILDAVMEIVAPILRERDEAVQRAEMAVRLEQETHDLADRSAKWEQAAMEQRQRADGLYDERERAISALSSVGRHAVEDTGDLEDGINADNHLAHAKTERAERDAKLANDAFEELYALGMRTCRHGDRYRLAWLSARRRAKAAREEADALEDWEGKLSVKVLDARNERDEARATAAERDATIAELREADARVRDLVHDAHPDELVRAGEVLTLLDGTDGGE